MPSWMICVFPFLAVQVAKYIDTSVALFAVKELLIEVVSVLNMLCR